MKGIAALMLVALAGCTKALPPSPGLEPEPLPSDGRPPPTFEAMLFGGQARCENDADCASGICRFGRFCDGLVTADEPWRTEKIGLRVRERLAIQPELRPLATSLIASIVMREEMGIAGRGRAARALGQIVEPGGAGAQEVVAELQRLIAISPATIAEVAALSLARLGDGTGLEIVMALTESPRAPSSIEALRLLGSGARGSKDDTALKTLLAHVSSDVDLERQRAAIVGLAALGDKRAIRPLVAHLATGPDALAETLAATLRSLTGATLGPDTLAWDEWVSQHAPPAAPAYTPLGHNSIDDIDLPTP